jgi:hypothetical protein
LAVSLKFPANVTLSVTLISIYTLFVILLINVSVLVIISLNLVWEKAFSVFCDNSVVLGISTYPLAKSEDFSPNVTLSVTLISIST